MEVQINTEEPLSEELLTEIDKEFGFECWLDRDEPGDHDYYVGYDPDSVGVEGCCDEDPMPYDEAVRLCGWLAKRGIEGWIDGDGGWANGMFRRTDFRGFAVSDEQKAEWIRVARIFWTEADPERLSEILPNDQGHTTPTRTPKDDQ